MQKQAYLTLPISNIEKSNSFFTKIGFTFNPQFSSPESSCIVLNDNTFVMLMIDTRFQEYTRKKVADAHQSTEIILGVNAESRQAVDDLIAKVIDAGGEVFADPVVHGEWLYSRSFYDVDGHQWEAFFFDASAMPTK